MHNIAPNSIYVIGGTIISDDKRSLVKSLNLQYPDFNFISYEDIYPGATWSKQSHDDIIENTLGCIIMANKVEVDDCNGTYSDVQDQEFKLHFGKGVYTMISDDDIADCYSDNNVIVISPCREINGNPVAFYLDRLCLNSTYTNDYKMSHAIYLQQGYDTCRFNDFIQHLNTQKEEVVVTHTSNNIPTQIIDNVNNIWERVRDGSNNMVPTNTLSKIYQTVETVSKPTTHSKSRLRLAYGCSLL